MGAVLFMSNRVHSYHMRADALYNNVALAEQKISNIDAQRKVLRQLAQEGIQLEPFFFAEGDALAFIRVLENAAKARGVSMSVLSVDNITKARAPLGAYSMSLELNGTFEEAVSFLAYVQSLPYALHIQAFDLTLIESENSTSWTATVSVAGAYVTTQYQLQPNL